MIFLGIDPGKSGGIAWIAPCGVDAQKMPDTEADVVELLRDLTIGSDTVVVIEKVNAMPGQGVHSTFVFGQHYGMLHGFLTALRVPFLEVSPLKWQRVLGVARPRGAGPARDASQQQRSAAKREHKNETKAFAQRLYPSVKKITHATADALLLATYGARQDWRGVLHLEVRKQEEAREISPTEASGVVSRLAQRVLENF